MLKYHGSLSLTDGEGSLVVIGQVQCLRRKGKVDPFLIEALHDLDVDPVGVLQIVPILGRVIPVDDDDVQGVSIEVATVSANSPWESVVSGSGVSGTARISCRMSTARVTFSGGVS